MTPAEARARDVADMAAAMRAAAQPATARQVIARALWGLHRCGWRLGYACDYPDNRVLFAYHPDRRYWSLPIGAPYKERGR